MKNSRRRRSLIQSQRFNFEKLEPRICLSTVPAFESLPGADHTIYLDFDGHVVQNSNWNSYYNQTKLTANPYDIDSNPAVFSPTEISRITEAYHRVAEDFRPFHVNVTTVEPDIERLRKSGSGDNQWGIRVIITNESTMVTDSSEYCGCGGIAYINSFNNSSDLPVWVYTTGGKSIAEAASHEVGHALGLSHDGNSSSTYYSGHGSGDTAWAPIMGVGYNRNVTQWDNGTFYGSNNGGSNANYGKGPDDLAIITTYNGFSFRADDHGNTNATASLLALNGAVVNDKGVIEKSRDVDVFTFSTGAGLVTLNVSSFLPGPNLDIQADLYDWSGTLVASSNPVSGLNASISMNLAAGQYYLQVDGVGVGNPTSSSPTGYSDYASLGSYVITGSIVDAGQLPQLSINDVIVNERDGTATFTVTRSGSATDDVTVSYGTLNDSAVSPDDFVGMSGSLTFFAGELDPKTIVVTIMEDSLAEGVETFVMALSNASGAFIADGQGIGTIIDNDTNLSIHDTSVNEGNLSKGKKNAGSANYNEMVFTVSLSNPVGHDVVAQWSTQDNSATIDNKDYEASTGEIIIPAGATSGTIMVRAIGDNDLENDETFFVNMTTVTGATITDGQADGTILDDDSAGGNGKGNGKGNSKGNGNPPGSATDQIVVTDDFFYFEDVGNDHDSVNTSERMVVVPFASARLAAESKNSRVIDRRVNEVRVRLTGETQRLVDHYFAEGIQSTFRMEFESRFRNSNLDVADSEKREIDWSELNSDLCQSLIN